MNRPRAADDFATIRARLRELRGEQAYASPADVDPPTADAQPARDAERRFRERRDGTPPPWAPTIFLRR
jgi:hypothetical protein